MHMPTRRLPSTARAWVVEKWGETEKGSTVKEPINRKECM